MEGADFMEKNVFIMFIETCFLSFTVSSCLKDELPCLSKFVSGMLWKID